MADQGPGSDAVRAALTQSQVIDLTTRGRKTGRLRRIEIFLHYDDGQLFISGMPRADRTRGWIHNIEAHPHVVVHMKQSVVADVPAMARVVDDPDERRPLIEAAARRWRRTDIEEMLRYSPLIVLSVDDTAPLPDEGRVTSPMADRRKACIRTGRAQLFARRLS